MEAEYGLGTDLPPTRTSHNLRQKTATHQRMSSRALFKSAKSDESAMPDKGFERSYIVEANAYNGYCTNR
jgi:hypothetical protein